MPEEQANRLRRPIHPMPDFVRRALLERNLMDAYLFRPPYQRNDYVGWISRAKLPRTWEKRLRIMLNELAAGHGYMGMEYFPSPRARRR
jgi:Bacteriocin-protection, YdeI or OmpD-Associated